MSGAVYRVTHGRNARLACKPGIAALARRIAQECADRSPHGPSGDMAAGWYLVQGHDPGTTLVANNVRHAVYVEYGTAHAPAHPVFGPVLAQWRQRTGARRRR